MNTTYSRDAVSFRRRRADQLERFPFCIPCSESGHQARAVEVVQAGSALLSVCAKHAALYARVPPRW
jgi:hypothetical protein